MCEPGPSSLPCCVCHDQCETTALVTGPGRGSLGCAVAEHLPWTSRSGFEFRSAAVGLLFPKLLFFHLQKRESSSEHMGLSGLNGIRYVKCLAQSRHEEEGVKAGAG